MPRFEKKINIETYDGTQNFENVVKHKGRAFILFFGPADRGSFVELKNGEAVAVKKGTGPDVVTGKADLAALAKDGFTEIV